jgi:phage/plasmid primase-like uncharacterized protein
VTKTVDAARGRWPEIFGNLGLPDGTWRKNCPICGGKDRIADRQGRRRLAYCQQCGP